MNNAVSGFQKNQLFGRRSHCAAKGRGDWFLRRAAGFAFAADFLVDLCGFADRANRRIFGVRAAGNGHIARTSTFRAYGTHHRRRAIATAAERAFAVNQEHAADCDDARGEQTGNQFRGHVNLGRGKMAWANSGPRENDTISLPTISLHSKPLPARSRANLQNNSLFREPRSRAIR